MPAATEEPRSDAAMTNHRIFELVREMSEAERELQSLVGGQVDSVTFPDGEPHLLHGAQAQFRRDMEVQLRAAELQRSVLDALPAHLAILSPDGTILAVNEEWRRFAKREGWSSDGFGVGANYLKVCAAAAGPGAGKAREAGVGIAQVLKGTLDRFELEYPCHSPNKQRWFRLNATGLAGHAGGGAVVMHIDITARRLAEEARAQGEHRFRAMVENGWDVVTLLGADGRVRYMSATVEKALGYPMASALIGEQSCDYVHPADKARWMRAFATALRNPGAAVPAQGRVRHVTGSWRPIAGIFNNLLHDPAVQGVVTTFRDITAEEASKLELERFFALSVDFFCTANVEGYFTHVNPAFSRALGYTEEEMLRAPIMEFVHPNDRAATLAALRESAVSPLLGFENRYVTKSGGHLPLQWNSIPVPEHGLIYAVARDVTQQHASAAALRCSEERFQLAVQASAAGLWDWTIGAESAYYSPRLLELLGLAELHPVPTQPHLIRDHVHPEDREAFLAAEKAYLEQRKPFSLDLRLRAARGIYRWFSLRAQARWGPDGCAARIVGQVLDVHERKVARQRVRELAERLSTTLESITDAFLTLDRDFRITYVNCRAEELVRQSRHELLGRHLWDAFPDGKGSAFDAAYSRALADNCPARVTAFYAPLRAWVEADAYPSGQGLAIYFRDVTSRKRAEDQIREQAALLDKARDAILALDLDGRVLYWNRSAVLLHGWSATEVLGRPASEFLYDPAGLATIETAHEDLMAHGEWTGDLLNLKKNGESFVAQTSWTLVRDELGEPSSILSISADVTERKRLEAEVLRSQRMDSIGTLAGGVAHDLNNVLAPVLMSLELLRGKLPDAEDRELLATVESSVERGAGMIRQILTFARGVEGPRLVVQPAKLVADLECIVRETFLRKVEFVSSVETGCWPVLGDPTQLHQVLLNLCVNARDAMPDGGTITIRVENARADLSTLTEFPGAGAGRYVVFSVRDTGVGMTKEVQARLFEPFFTTKELGKGTGLGLPTAAGIVKSHRGAIAVESAPGSGTTFRVYLPAHGAEEGGSTTSAPVLPPRAQGETILLIEDEATLQLICKKLLESHGYRVLTANDGVEALTLYAGQSSEIDAVLTDLMMPVMDGIATLHAMRRIDPALKAIAATGLPTPEQIHAATTAGASKLLAKPYDPVALLNALHTLLHG